MLRASDRKFSKSFIGDFTFDIERDRTRYPLFLNRNIMRVLDHHEKRSKAVACSSAVLRPCRASRQKSRTDPVTPPPRSTRLRDQLIEKFHQEDAELIFDVRSIRRKLNYKANLDERPRKRVKREAAECRCYFAVWDNREGHRQLEPILKRSEDCLVTPTDTASDVHAVEIELESPFRIPAGEFFVPILKDGQIIKWAIGDKYLLEIKIIPCNTSELWPPMPILSKSQESLARDLVNRKDLAFTEGMLISNYTNLPHAPPVGVPLDVAFDQGGRTFKTKYGLEISAEWTYPRYYEAKIKREEELLATRIEEEEKQDPLCRSIESRWIAKSRTLKPTKLDKHLPNEPNVKVSYIWDIETRKLVSREARTISLEGFHCPVCQIHEFPNVKRLQFHLFNNHDKYCFSIERQEQDPHTKIVKWVVFSVEVAEIIRPRATKHVKDEREFSWQRPERPFDLDAYLSGEQSWVGAASRRRMVAAAAALPQPLQVTTNSMTVQAAPVGGLKSTFRAADEVQEIPLPMRKKFKVPVAKTMKRTSFYRSINHRNMETGEMLSETDDDIDDAWLIKRHHDAVAEMDDLTEMEKSFRQRWNAHVLSEGSPSARYVSDSLIRFVRGNAAWLRGSNGVVGLYVHLQELASLLMERGLIDGRVLKDCLEIVQCRKDLGKEQISKDMIDGLDKSTQQAEAGSNNSAESQTSNLGEPPAHDPGGPAEREEEYQPEARTSSPRAPSETGYPEATTKTATGAPESAAEQRLVEVLQPAPTSLEKKWVSKAVANGFCGVCNAYIHRPKRNAITCSNSVSPTHVPVSASSNSFSPRSRALWDISTSRVITSIAQSFSSITSPQFAISNPYNSLQFFPQYFILFEIPILLKHKMPHHSTPTSTTSNSTQTGLRQHRHIPPPILPWIPTQRKQQTTRTTSIQMQRLLFSIVTSMNHDDGSMFQ